MRTKTTEQKEKILIAASELFGTQRFHQVRMDDIAERAVMGKGTLYRYFQDKEELYLAVLARSSELFIQRVTEAVAEVEGLREQLETLAALIVAHFDEQPHLLDLIQRAEIESPTGQEFPWRGARVKLTQLLLDLFAMARERGEPPIRNPELTVFMFFGGLRSVIRLGEKPRPRNLARCFVDNLLHGAQTSIRSDPRPTAKAQALLR